MIFFLKKEFLKQSFSIITHDKIQIGYTLRTNGVVLLDMDENDFLKSAIFNFYQSTTSTRTRRDFFYGSYVHVKRD